MKPCNKFHVFISSLKLRHNRPVSACHTHIHWCYILNEIDQMAQQNIILTTIYICFTCDICTKIEEQLKSNVKASFVRPNDLALIVFHSNNDPTNARVAVDVIWHSIKLAWLPIFHCHRTLFTACLTSCWQYRYSDICCFQSRCQPNPDTTLHCVYFIAQLGIRSDHCPSPSRSSRKSPLSFAALKCDMIDALFLANHAGGIVKNHSRCHHLALPFIAL